MILDALYSTLNQIVKAFPLIGDEIEATVPFLVFSVVPSPVRTKDGIIGYQQQVTISLVDVDSDNLDANVIAVKEAIEAMSGTVGGTEIEDVMLSDESGAYYNDKTNTLQYDLEYRFDTENR